MILEHSEIEGGPKSHYKQGRNRQGNLPGVGHEVEAAWLEGTAVLSVIAVLITAWVDPTCPITSHLHWHFPGVLFLNTTTWEPYSIRTGWSSLGRAEIQKQTLLPLSACIVCTRARYRWGHPDRQMGCGDR